MLDAVEPNEKAEEPDETAAPLAEGRAHAAMPFVLYAEVEVWPAVEGSYVGRVWFDVYLNLEFLVLFPELHDLICQADRYCRDLGLERFTATGLCEVIHEVFGHPSQ